MKYFEIFKFLRTSPPKENWGAIAYSISLSFANTRQNLFQVCVETLENTFYKKEIVSTKLNRAYSDEHTGIKIKAFQLVLAAYYIATKKYISRKNGSYFADLLWAQVLGNQMKQGFDFVTLFTEKVDSFPRVLKFFCLLSEDITGQLNPAEGMILLRIHAANFIQECFDAVAKSFDYSLAEQDISIDMLDINKWLNQLFERFVEEAPKSQQEYLRLFAKSHNN